MKLEDEMEIIKKLDKEQENYEIYAQGWVACGKNIKKRIKELVKVTPEPFKEPMSYIVDIVQEEINKNYEKR